MKFILSILTLFICFVNLAQYGNEWINYSQKYYQFKINEDGIYKIDFATLNNSGFPVSTILTENLQLFGFEKEQSIYINDGGDNSFDAGDYILFYGQKNNTWLDSILYESPNDVANKYVPHYNDTITYFLTWNNLNTNKRITEETDINYSAHSLNSYFLKTNARYFKNYYAQGFKSGGLSYSQYQNGEGWASNPVNGGVNNAHINCIINTANPYIGVNAPLVKGVSVSSSVSNSTYSGGTGNHHFQIINLSNNSIIEDSIFIGYQKNEINFTFPSSDISSNSTNIRHQIIADQGAASDHQVVHYVELTYPRTSNLNAQSYFEMELINGTSGKAYYQFSNFNASNPISFSINNGIITKIPVSHISSQYHVLVSNSLTGKQNFIILDESSIIDISQIQAVNSTGSFTNFNTSNFSNSYIIVSHQNLWSAALNYHTYRSGINGGNNNSILVDIDELILQFGGGVPKHILGLRRFQHFAYNQSPTSPPNHVFLIGKGIREANESPAAGFGMRMNATAYQKCLIPTFGYPASDILISSNLENNPFEPLIPMGRLAANTVAEVNLYLNKVKEFELAQDPNSIYTIPSKLWQKKILHFGGGSNAYEQSLFRSYLSGYENSLENSQFGGHVRSYYKTTTDPISPILTTEVNDIINSGVSFMTFFGHASATGFDQNVDDPENWNNHGKYPFVIGNSCLTGNIHEPLIKSTSESYLLIENKGAIAFIANVNQGYAHGLNTFSTQLFNQISNSNYGATIGQQIKELNHILQPNSNSFVNRTTLTQMTLHGDPALTPNSHQKPEIVLNQSGFYITPNQINLSVDSITVHVVLYNLGRSITDTFNLEIIRKFPNQGGDSLYSKLIYGLDYIDTIQIKIPLYSSVGIGLNEFEAFVDIPNQIDEQYDEITNNQIKKTVIFDINGIQPVWPYNYAVIPQDSLTIKASTINPFAPAKTYRFELDTTDLYNSAELRFKSVNSKGGVIEINPSAWLNAMGQSFSLILQDSMVYFWRVSIDEPGNYNWQEFSFQYIKGKNGWGQDHFFQFKNNDFHAMQYNRNDRLVTFNPSSKTIHCQVYGNANTNVGFFGTLWKLGGALADYAYCNTNPKIQVAVIDPNTLEPWATRDSTTSGTILNPNHNFGNSNDIFGINDCRSRPELFFSFEQHIPSQLSAFENMIQNEIPDGHYVLIYSGRQFSFSQWDTHYPQLYNLFQGLGSDSIAQGKPDVPYIAFYKKGDPSTFKEVYGQNINDYIEFDDTLQGFDFSGIKTSTIIGPANKWETLYWKQYSIDTPSEDYTRLKLYGLTSTASTPFLLIDTLFTNHDSILNLENINNINQFNLLQLQMICIDSSNNTPAQIDSWHVLYEPVPEAALSSINGYYLKNDSLQEGEKVAISFDIKNISYFPMDSILVNYWIENSNHQIIPINYPRKDSLRVGETIRDTIEIPTISLTDQNSLWVEINPYTNGVKDQPEMYHFNNFGQIPFHVKVDELNPILEVAFDNQFILNGDLVSPLSQVIITLKDENPYLLLDTEADTALFGIYLTDPDGVQKRLNFRNGLGEQILEWVPANASNKKFKIIYQGNFTEDGIYRLLVQGADKSGNISGDYNYDIEFEVDRHSSITHLMNYPNPFSTQTQFVFTLTGSQIPDELTIQILNATGTLVRTITIDELGPINIGRNITKYRWDGRDEFGDQLANGVYLYRVLSNINNQGIDHRVSGADQYITKGFGKMYLLR